MANKPLVFVVDATLDPFTRAMKAGKATLADFGKAAGDAANEVQERLRQISENPAPVVESLQKSLTSHVNAARAAADAALSKAGGGGTSQSSLDAAAAIEKLAAAERIRATAAANATAVDDREAAGLRLVATSAGASAVALEERAVALRTQAGILATVEAEEAKLGATTRQASGVVVEGHQRMSVSAQIMMHSVRSAGASFAAGLPPMMIFTEQLGRVAEAAAYSGPEGVMGKFGAFMSGPWGLAITAGVTVLGTLISHLGQSGEAASKAEQAHETLAEKLDLERHAYEEVIAAVKDYNREQERSRVLTLDAAAAVAQKAAQDLHAALALRIKLRAELAEAQANANANQGQDTGGGAGIVAQGAVLGAQSAVDKNEQDIKALQSGAFNAVAAVGTEIAKLNSDPRYAIEQRFIKLRNEAKASIHDIGALTDRLTTLDKQERAATKAYEESQHRHRGKSAETITRQERRDNNALTQAQDAADAQAAQIKRQNVTDIAEQARLDKAAVDAARQRERDATAASAIEHKWSAEATKALQAKQDQNAEAKKRAIDEKAARELADRDLQHEGDRLSAVSQLLDLQGQLADTTKERLPIALQILEIDRQQAINAQLSKFNRGELTPEELFTNIQDIDQQFDLKGKVIRDQNKSPMQRYHDQLTQHVGDMNKALENVKVDGLQNLEDGLVGIISGTESVSQAFKKMAASILADLARIAIEKAILSVIGFNVGSVPGHATGNIPGFASGIISGPGTGTSDSILAFHEGLGLIRVSNGESIITAEGTRKHRRLLKAINDDSLPSFAEGYVPSYPALPTPASLQSGGSGAPITFDLRGAVVTADLLQQMNAISARHAQAAVLGGAALAQQQLTEDGMARIPV